MENVPVNTWFPALTLALGFIFAMAADALKDRRQGKREREAREFNRREAIGLRRIDFQREALVDLLDQISKLARFCGSSHYQQVMGARATGTWGAIKLTEDVNEGFRATQAAISTTYIRVHDDVVRERTEVFKGACVTAVMAPSEAESFQAFVAMQKALDELSDRIGQVLRSLDSDEDEIVGK
ncbi:hypothetical protein [Brevundimonas sp.]|uniref:hypothetical protein n=1 Tax=Brevundimonas sp. TaxID=1871086 RepID=UPI002BA41440|nr:hypothetical protein [Brevundimonas sp.]HWQ85065.1 hypothetical protein [Brevundimonas sp.]